MMAWAKVRSWRVPHWNVNGRQPTTGRGGVRLEGGGDPGQGSAAQRRTTAWSTVVSTEEETARARIAAQR